jgi:hypothetical protein
VISELARDESLRRRPIKPMGWYNDVEKRFAELPQAR